MLNKKSSGFTLIELLVVVAMSAILLAISIPSFSSYNQSQILQAAVLDFTTAINTAKSRALSQVKPPQCISLSLTGYEVDANVATGSYQLSVLCGGNTYSVSAKNLPLNITFDSAATTSTSFFFPVLTGNMNGAGTVAIKGYGNTKTITVDANGNMTVN